MGPPGASNLPATMARGADDLVDMLGVNIHLSYLDTVYGSGFATIIRPRLQELGIRHVRDGTGGWDTGPRNRATLAADGIQFLMVIDPLHYNTAANNLAAVKAEPVASIWGFEAGNELDIRSNIYGGWPNSERNWLADVTAAFAADPATQGKPVMMGAPAHSQSLASLGPIDTPYANIHPYAGPTFPSNGLDTNIANVLAVAGNKPIVATELGWHTDATTTGFAGVSQLAQAKYLSRMPFEYFSRDIFRAYIYELINPGVNPNETEQNWGLLNNDGSPKPAFTTLKNIITLLSDPGPKYAHKSVRYQIIGGNANVHSTVLDTRDGRAYIALWQEVHSFDYTAQVDLSVPPQRVTIALADAWTAANILLPRTGGAASISPAALVVDVPDEVVIIELRP